MNTRILLLAISVAALSSCSSVYKSGQTPDDVYYSPAPMRQQADNNNNSYMDVKQPKDGTNYQSYEQYADNQRDDRFLRMSVGNPYYMNSYDAYSGFDWRYNSFYNGFNYGFSSPWNNYFAWNNFYNPYYAPGLSFGYGGFGGGYYDGGYYGGGAYYSGGGGVKYSIYTTPISIPRVFNVNNYSNNNRPAGRTYLNGSYYNSNQRYNNYNGNNNRTNNTYYNNTNNGRSMYTPSNSNSNNSYTPSRSYTPSAPSGGSSSGGGGGGISRPSRGN
ncbi:MAG: hypothetical protein NVSMB7_10930 [Chitinophagaceae bacterium]